MNSFTGQGIRDDEDSNRSVLRSASVMSGLTIVSRALGLIRDTVLGSVFGTTFMLDAFRIGFMLPNLFRRLLAEGSLTAAFIPIFTDYKNHHGREEAVKFLGTCFYTLGVILLGLVGLGIVMAPQYVPMFVPGAENPEGGWALIIYLTQLMFPYIFFISLAALAMAGLNTFKVFGPSMFTPILLNLSVIGCTMFLHSWFNPPILAPVVGVLIGGALQLSFQLPFLWKRGVSFRPSLGFRNKYIHKISRLMVPGVFGSGVGQINTLISVYFISLTSIEGLQWMMYLSGRIVEVVHGVYTIAISTALLPAMSEHAFHNDLEKLHDKLVYGLRMAALLAVPSTAGLLILRHDIVRVAFEHGLFSSQSTEMTANVLFYYSFCLAAWAGVYILNPAFYSLKDIWTPVKVAAVSMIVNGASNMFFINRLQEGAPPLSLALAGLVQLVLLWFVFRKKYGRFPTGPLVASLSRFLVGTALLVLFLCVSAIWQDAAAVQESFWLSLVWLVGRVCVAACIYFGSMAAMKSPEWAALMELAKSKFRR